MRAYIGTKIIIAEPRDELSFYQEMGRVFDKGENRPGYKVVYPDGYTSWSPKETFEQAYREVCDQEAELVLRGVHTMMTGAAKMGGIANAGR